MRVLAMYLPQFHRIPENDKWWGEGFTEWTAVKNAKPLFEGHDQPRVPLDENYYDLLDKKTMEWQAGLMHEYGIDGICIYHYWFGNGKKLLEKPAENLLQWKDIDMPFCFCWANETWARTWSNAGKWSKNAWAESLEPERNGDNKSYETGILMEQDYGDKNAWIEHFEYLLPFFRDERYIKYDEKPLVLIYKATEIDCLKEMLNCWRCLAVNAGFEGIYIIGGGLDRDISDSVDAVYYRAPADLHKLAEKFPNRVRKSAPINYKDVWDVILESSPVFDVQPFFMGIVGYDTSPRQGKKATIYDNSTPEEFERNLYKLMFKNSVYGSGITFINAWNEWGEGMYLEPDTCDGYAYLEAVKSAKAMYVNSDNGMENRYNYSKNELELLQHSCADYFAQKKRADANVVLLDKLLYIYEKGVDPIEYISKLAMGEVAVYGYGILGKHLCRMLIKKDIKINCILDMNTSLTMEEEIAKKVGNHICAITEMPEVDCVLVALSQKNEEITNALTERNVKEIFWLPDIIDGMIDLLSDG